MILYKTRDVCLRNTPAVSRHRPLLPTLLKWQSLPGSTRTLRAGQLVITTPALLRIVNNRRFMAPAETRRCEERLQWMVYGAYLRQDVVVLQPFSLLLPRCGKDTDKEIPVKWRLLNEDALSPSCRMSDGRRSCAQELRYAGGFNKMRAFANGELQRPFGTLALCPCCGNLYFFIFG